MNLRHAAALALVGWYLMVPPVVISSRTQNCSKFQADTDQALRNWTIFHAYDSADACEKGKHEAALEKMEAWQKAMVAMDPNKRCSDPTDATREAAETAMKSAAAAADSQCVFSDDPRLAK